MENNMNFFSIIPNNVMFDNELKDKAKLLFGQITSLSNKEGYCFATNKYFADINNLSEETISRLISDLVSRGHLHRTFSYKEGTKEIEKRMLYPLTISSIPIDEMIKGGIGQFVNDCIDQNVKDNNINNYNINNICPNEASPNPYKDRFDELWEYFPKKQGKKNAYIKYMKYIGEKQLTNRQIAEAINNYIDYIDENKVETKYVMMGSTFFGGRIFDYVN